MSRTAILIILVLSTAALVPPAKSQSYTSTSATGAWNTERWNNSTDGPTYMSFYTANNNVIFTSGTYSFVGGMGAGTNVGNVTVNPGVTVSFSNVSGTFQTNGTVRTIDVGTGGLFDLNGNNVSTAAGTGLIKSGPGVFGTGSGNFSGGFTLNAGTVIARGTTGLGSGTGNILNLNGGTLAANATRSFDSTRFGGGINIGGNVQFGELSTIVSLASSTANLSFANNVSLGSAVRTLTMGNNGTTTFSGIVSNTSGGLILAANAGTDGRFEFTNTANTFTGDISLTGGEARFTADGSLGNAANDVFIDGGRFGKASDATTVTLGAGRNLFVGDAPGTSISSPGSGILVYNNPIADIAGETGSWSKQGGGVLELGGASTYTGNTAINNGTVRLTTGSNRLPTTTVLSLGQAASSNLGTLDLNGFNQQLAGLNSISGTNAGPGDNVITSATPATLTIGGSGTYTFGDGSNANSGIISGAVSLVMDGLGTQILGDANTYTGTTTVNAGQLFINGNQSAATGIVTVGANATLGGSGTIGGATTIAGTHSPGTSPGIQTFSSDLTYAAGSNILWELIGNTISGRGTNFDGIDVGGNLNFSGSTALNLAFNSPGSSVNWTNALWTSSQTWDLFTVTGTISNLSNLDIFTFNWPDSTGALFNTVLPDSVFSLSQSGNIVQLNYSIIPEPSRLALLGLASGLLLLRRRRP